MNEQTNAATTTPKQKVLKVALLVAGLAVCAIGGMVYGKHTAKTEVVKQADGVKQKPQLSGEKLEDDANRLSDKEKERIRNDIMKTVERGLNAKYKRVPKNPTDDDVERIIKDVEQMTGRELDSKYKHLADNGKEAIKNEIVLEFKRSMENRRSSDIIEKRIEQLQELSNEELEKKAQGGDPYAQYALGDRILDTIDRWKAGANNREEGKAYDADIWTGFNVQVAKKRLQKLASEGNDYARYSLEDYERYLAARNEGRDTWQWPKPLNDYRFLDYSVQLFLAAAETAIEKDMHRRFMDKVGERLVFWTITNRSFKSPILKDTEFKRRWKDVKIKLKSSIVDIPDEP